MFGRIITIGIISCSQLVLAQTDNYKIVDSVSYALYSSQKWQELVDFGKEAKKNGFDYHYLNLRIGIGYYQLNEFYRAEKYLSKAYKQNEGSDVAASYLYDVSYRTNNILVAGSMHSQVTKDSIRFSKAFSTLNADAGMKVSADRTAAGDIGYFTIGLGHLPTKKIALYQNYTFQLQRNNIWGNFNQHQYYLGGSFKLKGYWRLDLAGHYHKYSSSIQFKFDTSEVITTPPSTPGGYRIDSMYRTNYLMKGNYLQKGTLFYIGTSYQKGAFKISPFVQLNVESSSSDLILNKWQDTLIVKQKFNSDPIEEISSSSDTLVASFFTPKRSRQALVGGDFSYVLPFQSERFTLGVSVFQSLSKDNYKTIISPYTILRFEKSSWYASYFYKGSFPLSENYGSVLINTYDVINHRINLQFYRRVSKNMSLKMLYQFEDKTDNLSLIRYSTHMMSAGVNFKF
jgi:hypothetical protein